MREIDNNNELRARKNNARKSGYRRKHAFGARQSGKAARVQYRAIAAHHRCADRARRPKMSKLAHNDTLRQEVQSRLELRHSPEQIATRLRIEFRDDSEMWVSHEAIYQAIYVQGRGALRRELHQCLRPSGRCAVPSIGPALGRAASRTWSTSVNAQPRWLTGRCPGTGKAI
jgi:IS30 family transposase